MCGWPLSCLMASALLLSPLAARAQDDVSAQAALEALQTADFTNAYLPFVRYALAEAAKRERDAVIGSAILDQRASILDPKTVPCYEKPLAAIIDLDVAPGTPAEMEIEPQAGFAYLLETMRDSGIRIVWLAETGEGRLAPILNLLREGEAAVMQDSDLMLVGLPGSASKQDRRLQLARDYCVVAIAGDRKADFDELYDYLRDQSYAIRLEAYTDRGWFLLPHPVAAIDSERLAISPDQKAEQ